MDKFDPSSKVKIDVSYGDCCGYAELIAEVNFPPRYETDDEVIERVNKKIKNIVRKEKSQKNSQGMKI